MKTTTMRLAFLGAIGSVAFVLAQAGDLEPPGPPAPTMVTLQEVFDKLDGLTASVGRVAKTGQTGCWDVSGISIPCAGTGQDGEFQAGVSVDPRFMDNGDGTVTDNLTGLIWLQDANCFGPRDWTTALSDANGLADGSCGLTDSSLAGDWRLPNVKELLSLLDFSQDSPALPPGHPFTGLPSSTEIYVSSTTIAASGEFAWHPSMFGGNLSNGRKTILNDSVWPVRGGL